MIPEVAAAVLARADGRCEVCDTGGWVELHHRQLRSQGGPHTIANLVVLCKQCHDRVHRFPRWARDQGLIVSGHAPAPENEWVKP